MLRHLICSNCGKDFKTYHKSQYLCSTKCRSEIKETSQAKKCITCGKIYIVQKYRSSKTKYCSRSCLAKTHLKKFSEFWFKPSNQAAHKYKQIMINGKPMREHRWIMQNHLGRKLSKDEHVHHIDGNGMNNEISNLIVLSNANHQKLHRKN